MVNSFGILHSDDREIEEYIQDSRKLRDVRPQETPPRATNAQNGNWFERQSVRLAQLEASPTRALTDEERQDLQDPFVVGPSVQVCEFPTPPDEYQMGFAMGTPVANVLYGYSMSFAVQMALRMEMLTGRHSDPQFLVWRCGVTNAPLVLFCGVKRPRCPAKVVQASIGVGGSSNWFTHYSNTEQQILLVHRIGDFAPTIDESDDLEYLLCYPKAGAEEDET